MPSKNKQETCGHLTEFVQQLASYYAKIIDKVEDVIGY